MEKKVKKYRLRQQIVKAVEYDGDPESLMAFGATGFAHNNNGYDAISINVPSRAGSQNIYKGDFLVLDSYGDFHVMKKERFHQFFEEIAHAT